MVLSVKVPVAVNCCVSPLATEVEAGVTVMDTSSAGMTVRTVEPETLPEVAVMVVVPSPTAVARPVPLMAATVVAELAQVAVPVRSWGVLSVKVPVAVNCCVSPFATEVEAGVTVIATSSAGVTVKTVEPEMLPEVAVMVVVPSPTEVARPVPLMVATAVVELAQLAVAVRS